MLNYKEYQLPNIDKEIEQASLATKEGEDTIVCSHLKLVLSISEQYKHVRTNRISYEDIVQVGILGLYEALKKYDPDRNVRFSTLARTYIKNSIRQYLRNNSHFLSIPQKTLWQIYRLKRLIESNPEADINQIAFALQMEVGKVYDLLSLSSLCECGPMEADHHPGEDQIPSKRIEALKSLISDLDEQEKKILDMRNIQEMSWREIGRELGLSHEAVRKQYNKIVKKLREKGDALSKGI